jgi:hippurate hydrolase
MGGEDFAFMLLERPGAFIFLGINNDDETKRGQPHSPTYNFNDEAIPFGVAYWITLVQKELNN